MKKCPRCSTFLDRIEYEGVKVLQCPSCNGHLVGLALLGAIENRGIKKTEEHQQDVIENYRKGSHAPVSCPRCLRTMESRRVSTNIPDVTLDFCRKCSLMWFDGGEMAIAQMHHETGPEFKDYRETVEKYKALLSNPERLQKFKDDMEKLPDFTDPLQEVFNMTGEVALYYALRGRRNFPF